MKLSRSVLTILMLLGMIFSPLIYSSTESHGGDETYFFAKDLASYRSHLEKRVRDGSIKRLFKAFIHRFDAKLLDELAEESFFYEGDPLRAFFLQMQSGGLNEDVERTIFYLPQDRGEKGCFNYKGEERLFSTKTGVGSDICVNSQFLKRSLKLNELMGFVAHEFSRHHGNVDDGVEAHDLGRWVSDYFFKAPVRRNGRLTFIDVSFPIEESVSVEQPLSIDDLLDLHFNYYNLRREGLLPEQLLGLDLGKISCDFSRESCEVDIKLTSAIGPFSCASYVLKEISCPLQQMTSVASFWDTTTSSIAVDVQEQLDRCVSDFSKTFAHSQICHLPTRLTLPSEDRIRAKLNEYSRGMWNDFGPIEQYALFHELFFKTASLMIPKIPRNK